MVVQNGQLAIDPHLEGWEHNFYQRWSFKMDEKKRTIDVDAFWWDRTIPFDVITAAEKRCSGHGFMSCFGL